jgi:hypothetical protein
MKKFIIPLVLLAAGVGVFSLSLSPDTVVYRGLEVRVVGDECSSNPPYPCYKKVRLPDGKIIKLDSQQLK